MLPGFTSFVRARKIKSTNGYQTSKTKYSSNIASSSRVVPMAVCTREADIESAWNRPRPPDEGCKWRKVGDSDHCECLWKHWYDKGQRTQLECNGIARISDSTLPRAQCWERGFVGGCGGSCGPNPEPGCDPEYCPLPDGRCVHWSSSEACGSGCEVCHPPKYCHFVGDSYRCQ